jgi:hypothetical protein
VKCRSANVDAPLASDVGAASASHDDNTD